MTFRGRYFASAVRRDTLASMLLFVDWLPFNHHSTRQCMQSDVQCSLRSTILSTCTKCHRQDEIGTGHDRASNSRLFETILEWRFQSAGTQLLTRSSAATETSKTVHLCLLIYISSKPERNTEPSSTHRAHCFRLPLSLEDEHKVSNLGRDALFWLSSRWLFRLRHTLDRHLDFDRPHRGVIDVSGC